MLKTPIPPFTSVSIIWLSPKVSFMQKQKDLCLPYNIKQKVQEITENIFLKSRHNQTDAEDVQSAQNHYTNVEEDPHHQLPQDMIM